MTLNRDFPDSGLADAHVNNQGLSPTQQLVAGIWASALERQEIRLEDDFLELGGDSVTMMMVLFQVRETLGVDLPPEALLKATTLRAFCTAVDAARRGATGLTEGSTGTEEGTL